MAESTSVVLTALFADSVLAVLKFVGFLLTGSAAMLSESYHSISDTKISSLPVRDPLRIEPIEP